jgi:isoleucyl-tRNA synthetase
MNKLDIAKDVKQGLSNVEYGNIKLDLTKHIIKEIELSNDLVSSDFNGGNVILHSTQDEILLEEGYLRELTRRVQQMRKEMNMNKNELIDLSFEGSDEYYIDLINNAEEIIKKRVGAQDILQKKVGDIEPTEFKIKDHVLVISISK